LQARVFLFSIFFFFTLLSYSQEKNCHDTSLTRSSINFNVNTGTLLPHEKFLNPLKKGIVKSYEFSYSIKAFNGKEWHRYYSYPEVGISYMYMNLGYKKVLGYSHSIYPYIVFPLTKQDKAISVSLRTALGLSYINKTYDSLSNYENVAISSHINYIATLGVILNYRLTKNLSASIGVNAFHYSNGAIKNPNYGLNILTAGCGAHYNFYKENKYPKVPILLKNENARWLAILSVGTKEVKKPGGPKYGVGSLSIEYSRPFKTLLRYGLAFDYMYDASTFVHFREDSIQYHSQMKASKLGICGIGEMSLYRLSIFWGLGVYLFNKDKQVDPIYQRIGLRYRLNQSLYAQLALKTHLNIADYIEFGIGIALKKPDK